MNRTQLSQVIYKTAVENKSPEEIADDMELTPRVVKRYIKINKYAIQKRAMEFVDSTLDNALLVVKNTVEQASKLSDRAPSEMSKEELNYQKTIGLPCVDKALEVSGIVGAPKSQSGVTQNIFQQNNTQLSGNVKDFLREMSSNLQIEEGEVINGETEEEETIRQEINETKLDDIN